MDHDWPAELDSDARCERCGLEYGQWSEDDPDCHAKDDLDYTAISGWNIDHVMQTVVLITTDEGAEWAETDVYGPFKTLGDAEEFIRACERGAKANPDGGSVTCWVGYLRTVTPKDVLKVSK